MENMQDKVEPDQAKEPEIDIEQLKASIMEEAKENFKSEIAGLNRKVGELTKEKQEVEEAAKREAEAKLSTAERLARLEEEIKLERIQKEKIQHENKMTKIAIAALEASKLPTDLASKVDLTSEETILNDIELYASLFLTTEQTVKDDVRKKFSFTPTGGEGKKTSPKSWSECRTKEEKIAYLRNKRGE